MVRLLLWACWLGLLGWAQPAGTNPTVRILLEEVSQARVEIGSHQQWSALGRLVQPGGQLELSGQDGLVVLGGLATAPWLELEGEGFSLGSRSYRGRLLVVAQANRLLLINRLPLEEYLQGVVPAEVPRTFPPEALRAQAILARTYALHRLNPQGLYDLCDDERCQVYLGKRVETAEHNAAILATTGLVLSYQNRLISALYHSDSGGYTASAAEVWGQPVPYLVPRPDPFAESPRSHWSQTLDPLRVAQVAGWPVDQPLLALEVLGYSDSGRVAQLRLLGALQSTELSGTAATRFLRLLGLPSTRLRFDGWEVSGQGSGHGVGLSQWGARGLALQGWDYRQILGYYFPGTQLASFGLVLLGPGLAAHQPPQFLGWTGPAVHHLVNRLGQGQVLAHLLGPGVHGPHGIQAFGYLFAGLEGGQIHPPGQLFAGRPVARMQAGTGSHQVTQPRQPIKGLGLGTQRYPQTYHLTQPPGDQGSPAVIAQPQTIGDTRRQRHHILEGTAQLYPQPVGAGINPETGPAQGLLHLLSQFGLVGGHHRRSG